MDTGREKVNTYQYTLLLITVVAGTGFFFVPGATAKVAGPDSWVGAVLGAVPGFVAVDLAHRLSRRFPGKTIAQFSQAIIGSWPGKALGALYGVLVVHLLSVVLGEIGGFLATVIMPQTPAVVTTGLMAFVAAYGAANGLEVIGRANEIVLPAGVLLGVSYMGLLVPRVDLGLFRPVLSDPGRALRGSITPSVWRMELGLIATIAPQVNRPDGVRRGGMAAIVFLTVLLAAEVIIVVGALGTTEAGRLTYALFSAGDLIQYAGFLERLDALIMVAWVALSTMKSAIFTYCGALTLSQSLGTGGYRLFAWPVAAAAATLSVIRYVDYHSLTEFVERTAPFEMSLMMLVIPAILLGIAAIRGPGGTGT